MNDSIFQDPNVAIKSLSYVIHLFVSHHLYITNSTVSINSGTTERLLELSFERRALTDQLTGGREGELSSMMDRLPESDSNQDMNNVSSVDGGVSGRQEVDSRAVVEHREAKEHTGLRSFAKNVAGSIARTAVAAGTLMQDASLRRKGASVISSQASKAFRPFQHGLVQGAQGLQRGVETLFDGPRQVQHTLSRLSKQYSQQRMKILLEKQRDESQDVQIGFVLYEDAPQELRGRLWMALLGDDGSCLVEAFSEEYSKKENHAAVLQAMMDMVIGDESCHGEVSDLPLDTLFVFQQAGKMHRVEPWTTEKEIFKNTLMEAMTRVEWPIDDMTSKGKDEDQYETLLQISIGQEDIDDIIARDIHRTFPEHPLFGFEQGQKALFNLLKAYSLHDLEVGYCQGMAFVAGLLLFYVPEHNAFQVFCRLMDGGDAGIGLRKMYLPGLEGLKDSLVMFEYLMQTYLPKLKCHLEEHGAVPILYATQWFLSMFSCPFPVPFCARLIDFMLLQGNDSIMLRTAVSVMAEFESELLARDDFEALLTCLKVDPVTWDSARLRRVMNAAINSPISEEELEYAFQHVREMGESIEEEIAASTGSDTVQNNVLLYDSEEDGTLQTSEQDTSQKNERTNNQTNE